MNNTRLYVTTPDKIDPDELNRNIGYNVAKLTATGIDCLKTILFH